MNISISESDIKPLISESDINSRLVTLAKEIADSMPRDMMIVSLLRGSFVFTADLIRSLYVLGVRPQVDFMTLASYGDSTISSGKVNIIRDISDDVKGREVLIVDDILESGRTLNFAKEELLKRGADNCKIAVMLEKPDKRKTQIDADFVGFVVPDKFVVGYGLDYANRWRELPFIGFIEG